MFFDKSTNFKVFMQQHQQLYDFTENLLNFEYVTYIKT